ncbi:MAG TPA: hypothetical protein VGI81_05255 [Tepidisphaeraceae bacterium]|jgi:hypothetical protein
MMNLLRLNGLSFLGLLALGATFTRADVTVDRQPTVVERRTFDPAHRPADMPPLQGNEAAVTESKFDCKVGMDYRVLDHNRRPDGCAATLQIRGIHIELQLKVLIWLPEHAPAKLVAHEEGHRRIAERVYAQAEQAARAIARPIDGKRVTGDGADCAAAEKRATESTADGFCKECLRQTATTAGRVGDVYDDLTAHGTRAEPAEDEAIRQAFQKVESEARK